MTLNFYEEKIDIHMILNLLSGDMIFLFKLQFLKKIYAFLKKLSLFCDIYITIMNHFYLLFFVS